MVLQSDATNEIAEVWGDVGVTLSRADDVLRAGAHVRLPDAVERDPPAADLTAAFARVGERDYRERVSERGPLELVSLYQGFNQMVERLAHTEPQNKRLQEQLTTVQDEDAPTSRAICTTRSDRCCSPPTSMRWRSSSWWQGRRAIPERVGIIREAIGQMQRHVRDILGRLRPAVLLDMGLAHAIDNLVSFWRAHRPNLNFRVGVDQGFGEVLDAAVYRIVQESLSNAVRHGNPSIEISVTADANQSILIRVIDEAAASRARPAGRFGIVGMQERVATLGGASRSRTPRRARCDRRGSHSPPCRQALAGQAPQEIALQ